MSPSSTKNGSPSMAWICTGSALRPNAELRNGQAAVEEKRPASAFPGLDQLLGRPDAHGKPGIDQPAGKTLNRLVSACHDFPKTQLPQETHAAFDVLKRVALEKVGGMNGVARAPQRIGKLDHAGG